MRSVLACTCFAGWRALNARAFCARVHMFAGWRALNGRAFCAQLHTFAGRRAPNARGLSARLHPFAGRRALNTCALCAALSELFLCCRLAHSELAQSEPAWAFRLTPATMQ